MTTQSEQQLENGLIKRLVENGYERVLIPNVQALSNNFRNQMNRLNAENLNGQDLTDTEFQRLSLTIEGKSVFESAKILRDNSLSLTTAYFTRIICVSPWNTREFRLFYAYTPARMIEDSLDKQNRSFSV